LGSALGNSAAWQKAKWHSAIQKSTIEHNTRHTDIVKIILDHLWGFTLVALVKLSHQIPDIFNTYHSEPTSSFALGNIVFQKLFYSIGDWKVEPVD
jgi:hypothetical protein